MIFVEERVRNLIDLKIYIDTPNDIRFIRRLERDMSRRGVVRWNRLLNNI